MSYRFLGIIFWLTLSLSCNEKKQSFETKVKEFKEQVSNDVFLNFQFANKEISNIKSQCILFPEAIYASGYCGIFSSIEFSDEEFKKESDKLLKQSKFETSVFDSCNLYLFDSVRLRKKECLVNLFFLPPLYDQFNCLKKSKFDSTSTILVFESKPGKFTADENLNANEQMPEQWRHGFSNGGILNRRNKEIIYWLIIW